MLDYLVFGEEWVGVGRTLLHGIELLQQIMGLVLVALCSVVGGCV